jgi:hypothetical protein
LNVIADAGYSNGEQAAQCEAQGIVPARATIVRSTTKAMANCSTAPVRLRRKDGYVPLSGAADAGSQTTLTQRPLGHVIGQGTSMRRVCTEAALHQHIAALDHPPSARRHAAEDEPPTPPQIMRLRRYTVERPFALLKYLIFGYPRFLLRGLVGAQVETGFATLAYNLKTLSRVLGSSQLVEMLAR